jgi:hypothetical protein
VSVLQHLLDRRLAGLAELVARNRRHHRQRCRPLAGREFSLGQVRDLLGQADEIVSGGRKVDAAVDSLPLQ